MVLRELSLPEAMLDPRLSERFRTAYKLGEPPRTLSAFARLLAERTRGWLERVRSGDRVIGQTDMERGQSVALADGAATNVMCGYDALMTAVLRGQGLVPASCFHCGAKMEVHIEDGRAVDASPATTVFWLGDGPKGLPVCDHLNLFPDLEHLRGWLETNPDELGVPLLVVDAVKLLDHVARSVG